jgi:hypothetical protein
VEEMYGMWARALFQKSAERRGAFCLDEKTGVEIFGKKNWKKHSGTVHYVIN